MTIMIAHQDGSIRDLLSDQIHKRISCDITSAPDLNQIFMAMTQPEGQTPSIAFLDIDMASMASPSIFSFFRSLCHEIPVVAITHSIRSPFALQMIEAGACDILKTPPEISMVNKCLNNALAHRMLRKGNHPLLPQAMVSLVNDAGEIKSLHDIEEEAIRFAMQNGYSKSHVADRLGIGRTTLYRKMQQFTPSEC